MPCEELRRQEAQVFEKGRQMRAREVRVLARRRNGMA